MSFLSRPPSQQKRTLRHWNWLQRSKPATYSVTKLKERISHCRAPQELALAVNPAKLLRNAYKHTPPNPEEEEKANCWKAFPATALSPKDMHTHRKQR